MKKNQTLKGWHPIMSGWDREHEPPEHEPHNAEEADGVILLALTHNVDDRDLVTLHRAAERSGLDGRLRRENPALDGEAWYDGLEKLIEFSIEVRIDEQNTVTLEAPRERGDNEIVENEVVDGITVRGKVVGPNGAERLIELNGDFAIGSEYESQPAEAGILVTGDCELDIGELAKLTRYAIFTPDCYEKADTYDRQESDFRQAAHNEAAKLLLDPKSARYEAIAYAVQRHVAHLLPIKGRTVLRTHGPDTPIEVESAEEEKNAPA